MRRLADLEAGQADYWAGLLPSDEPPADGGLRRQDQVLLWLARRAGVRSVLPLIATDALRGVESYRAQPDAAPVLATELEVASRAAALAGMASPLIDVARDHRRQAAVGGSPRAAVFGVNDGLVSNLSLVMGVAGAAPPREFVLLAGLLAGAFSMAAGEFIAVLSQRELFERQIAVERRHIELAPDAERAMLAGRYEDKGLSRAQAEAVAERLMADPETALDTIAREQLGLDPDELGAPRAAALASFLSFALGAVLPVLPFLILSGWAAIIASAALGAAALFLVGVGVSYFTGRSGLLSGSRMLGLGAGAAALTFVIGRIIGVSVGG